MKNENFRKRSGYGHTGLDIRLNLEDERVIANLCDELQNHKEFTESQEQPYVCPAQLNETLTKVLCVLSKFTSLGANVESSLLDPNFNPYDEEEKESA